MVGVAVALLPCPLPWGSCVATAACSGACVGIGGLCNASRGWGTAAGSGWLWALTSLLPSIFGRLINAAALLVWLFAPSPSIKKLCTVKTEKNMTATRTARDLYLLLPNGAFVFLSGSSLGQDLFKSTPSDPPLIGRGLFLESLTCCLLTSLPIVGKLTYHFAFVAARYQKAYNLW